MIRLRIERASPTEFFPEDGLYWFKGGDPVGRAILEQEEVAETKIHPEYGKITAYKWVPVEVIDEG